MLLISTGAYTHQIVSTVTDLTKVIDGVTTIVVYEQDIPDGRLEESELLFAAQDDSGGVWHVGEYPGLYSAGHLTGAPDSWLSGVAGAWAGIDMPTTPAVGLTIVQGYPPSIQFWDWATFTKLLPTTCVAIGCYRSVLVANQLAPNDPTGGHQVKFHTPDRHHRHQPGQRRPAREPQSGLDGVPAPGADGHHPLGCCGPGPAGLCRGSLWLRRLTTGAPHTHRHRVLNVVHRTAAEPTGVESPNRVNNPGICRQVVDARIGHARTTA